MFLSCLNKFNHLLSFSFQVSKKFFPKLAIGFEDPRVSLHIGDGEKVLQTYPFLSAYKSG